MRLATWNVNSLKARLPRVLELIEVHAPDVICLQETKCPPDAFPSVELEALGYRAVHHSAGRWAGVAILARDEPADPQLGLPGEPAADQARWIEATVGDLRIATAYVPNGQSVGSEPFTHKLAFYEAMAERLRALRGRALAVCGDMNVCPTDLDVYDPSAFIGSTHVTEDERSRFAAVLEAGELADAFRSLHPEEQGYTWWDYRAGHFHKKMGLRIDFWLLSAEVAPRLAACGIDRGFRKGPKPSDHAPLLLELDG